MISECLLGPRVSTPKVYGGQSCIRGLRIRVKDILDMLAGGATRQEILADYPYLEDEDVTAALEYASRAAVSLPSERCDRPVPRTPLYPS